MLGTMRRDRSLHAGLGFDEGKLMVVDKTVHLLHLCVDSSFLIEHVRNVHYLRRGW